MNSKDRFYPFCVESGQAFPCQNMMRDIISTPLNFFLHNPHFSLLRLYLPCSTKSACILYSTVTYTLLGCMNVLCNRPIPAHVPTHPASHPINRPYTPSSHPAPRRPSPPPHPPTRPHPDCQRSHTAPPCPTRPVTPTPS